MSTDLAIAIMHTIGGLMFIGLAVEVYWRHSDVFATCVRAVLGIWFLRLACAWWNELGYSRFAWAAENDAIFMTGLLMYITFYIADRHRWWKEGHR